MEKESGRIWTILIIDIYLQVKYICVYKFRYKFDVWDSCWGKGAMVVVFMYGGIKMRF